MRQKDKPLQEGLPNEVMFRYIRKRSISRMNFNTLEHVLQQIYRCFERSGNALFNLSDAIPTSVVEGVILIPVASFTNPISLL